MILAPSQNQLSESQIEAGLRGVLKDGLTTQAMLTLSGGAFLVDFALQFGASNLLIGILAAIPFLAQLVQVPAIYLIEKLRARRLICVLSSGVGRAFLLLAAAIPFFSSGGAALAALIACILIYALFAAISGCSWNSWMRDLIPLDRLGGFFARRMAWMAGFGIVVNLAAAVFVDWYEAHAFAAKVYGYSALLFAGGLAGMLGVYFISTIPEPAMTAESRHLPFAVLLRQPFKDRNFRRLITFQGAWNFAINLAAPFFTVYMLKMLALDMRLIISLQVLSQVMNLLFFRIWGRLADRFSNKSVLSVSAPLYMICVFAFTFTTLPDKYVLTVPLLIFIHVFMGIATAGVTLATGNIGLKLAPQGQATAYLAANSLINSLAAGLAPILGGNFVDLFSGYALSWTLRWRSPAGEVAIETLDLQHWDFFFILACLLGLYAMHRLAKVKEVGEVEEEIVIVELIAEARRFMFSLSTIAGLRAALQFPFSLLAGGLKKRNNENNRRQELSG
ncbi:MAG: MFS transporter [candidate division KSB1 bacterium]|nr:MFS transporter [candidate division KSB1 bacterium]MDZ7274749.1 MFS transporter [candidate division KSB1 bacterium]MDZ7285574.1 MFS transporter [candidate division KSB1 bacterium]MDZ7298606.1 MFS transporter [candidate division KSB1 bacterium]MDZ7309538.1 MFS transporter [candidate division KSB1 bacterium]